MAARSMGYFELTIEASVACGAFTRPIDVHTDAAVPAKAFFCLVFRLGCVHLKHYKLSLTEASGEGGGTHTGEVGHMIDALSSVQTGLGVTFIYVCLTQEASVPGFTNTCEVAGSLNALRVVVAGFVFALVDISFTMNPSVSRRALTDKTVNLIFTRPSILAGI